MWCYVTSLEVENWKKASGPRCRGKQGLFFALCVSVCVGVCRCVCVCPARICPAPLSLSCLLRTFVPVGTKNRKCHSGPCSFSPSEARRSCEPTEELLALMPPAVLTGPHQLACLKNCEVKKKKWNNRMSPKLLMTE